MQITGDWALGEFAVNNKLVGKDFGCLAAPGTSAGYIVSVDVFAFPKNSDGSVAATQKKLARVMMDPPMQAEFARIKGSNPAAATPTQAAAPVHADRPRLRQQGAGLDPPNWQLSFSADAEGQIVDLGRTSGTRRR
jgi:glucose/mannose transport system substrate-binding protein